MTSRKRDSTIEKIKWPDLNKPEPNTPTWIKIAFFFMSFNIAVAVIKVEFRDKLFEAIESDEMFRIVLFAWAIYCTSFFFFFFLYLFFEIRTTKAKRIIISIVGQILLVVVGLLMSDEFYKSTIYFWWFPIIFAR